MIRTRISATPYCDFCGLPLAAPVDMFRDFKPGEDISDNHTELANAFMQLAQAFGRHEAVLRDGGVGYTCGSWEDGSLPCPQELESMLMKNGPRQ